MMIPRDKHASTLYLFTLFCAAEHGQPIFLYKWSYRRIIAALTLTLRTQT